MNDINVPIFANVTLTLKNLGRSTVAIQPKNFAKFVSLDHGCRGVRIICEICDIET
jgi:hypothetical protein